MARNPLYPRTAGETAVDKFLNDTLPRIIQARSDRRREDEALEYKKEQDLIQNTLSKESLDLRKEQALDSWIGTQKDDYASIYEAAEEQWLKGNEARGDSILQAGYDAMNADFTKRGINIDDHITTFKIDLDTGAKVAKDSNLRTEVWGGLTNPASTKKDINNAVTTFYQNQDAFPVGSKVNTDIIDFLNEKATSQDPRFSGVASAALDATVFSKLAKYGTDSRKDSAATDPEGMKAISLTFKDDIAYLQAGQGEQGEANQRAMVERRYNERYGEINKNKANEYILNVRGEFATKDIMRTEMGKMGNRVQDILVQDGFYNFEKTTLVDYEAAGFGDFHKKVVKAKKDGIEALETLKLENAAEFQSYKDYTRKNIKEAMLKFGYLESALDRQFPRLKGDISDKTKKEIETKLTPSEQIFSDAGFEFKQSRIMEDKDKIKDVGVFTLDDGTLIQLPGLENAGDVPDELLLKLYQQENFVNEDGTLNVDAIREEEAKQNTGSGNQELSFQARQDSSKAAEPADEEVVVDEEVDEGTVVDEGTGEGTGEGTEEDVNVNEIDADLTVTSDVVSTYGATESQPDVNMRQQELIQIYGDPDEMGASFLERREQTPLGYMGEFGRGFKNIGLRLSNAYWGERNNFLDELTMYGKENKNRGLTINSPNKDWKYTSGQLFQLNKMLRSVKQVQDKGVEGFQNNQKTYDRNLSSANKNVDIKRKAVEKKIAEHEKEYGVNLSLIFNSKTGLFEVKLAPSMNAEQQKMLASGSI